MMHQTKPEIAERDTQALELAEQIRATPRVKWTNAAQERLVLKAAAEVRRLVQENAELRFRIHQLEARF
jgi:hypothetical protein